MPEFIALDEFPPLPKRKSGAPRIQAHPCANCARQVVAPTVRRIYCSDLCSQVTSWIRYFQKAKADGRILLPDVHEALGIKLAHIAAGGYAETARRLPPELRDAIGQRDGGICRECGAPGSDIDHIDGSSADPENLQLLCRECHNAKTQRSMVVAEMAVVEAVHRPIQRRALESHHRQPCDSIEWQLTLWIKGALEVPTAIRSAWASWLTGPGSGTLDPAIAGAGFPPDLEPWSWYTGDRPEVESANADEVLPADWPKEGVPFSIGEPVDEETAARQQAVRESNRRFWEEWERRTAAAEERTIVHLRPFRAPVSGKGKWHTSYADVAGSDVPPCVTDPERTPACGSPTVEIDPTSEALYPAVGEKRSKYTDRLCGNCIRIE
jgi:hypothetical protein